MFVRWKARGTTRPPRWDGRALGNHAAYLVESARTGSHPRQRTVTYLGSISAHDRTIPWGREGFWRKLEPRLAALELPDAERARIVAALSATVPRPTPDELAAEGARVNAILAELRGM